MNVKPQKASFQQYSKRDFKKDLPTRQNSDHKGRGGKCLIIAGSRGMWGASALCAEAASRVGAGYVYLRGISEANFSLKHPDFLTLPPNQKIQWSMYEAFAIGPGLKGRPRYIMQMLKYFLQEKKPVVLDAEALNVLAQQKSWKKFPSNWIMTPHEGELARLLKVPSAKIHAHRQKYVLQAQQQFGCVVLLKGYQTLIASPEGFWQIRAGNPSLAKAGTGDVLTGIIVGLLSQKIAPSVAACMGACLHGVIADEWVKTKDILSLMASDLIKALPETLFQIRKNKL